METVGFLTYLLFMVSWFLHLTARVPVLGSIRFDFLLVLIIIAVKFMEGNDVAKGTQDECSKKLKYLIITILIITPFVEWPGSVVSNGIPNFIKAVVFFYFTVWYVNNQKRLYAFLTTYVFCQTFRILEPLYLHVADGYWGSKASMTGWEYMDRLAGAPSDVINPNGLAYVILSVLPFIVYFYRKNLYCKIFAIVFTPLALYVMMLTGSRSGVIGLFIMVIIIIQKSKHRIRFIIGAAVVFIVLFIAMTNIQKDRYESIYNPETRNAHTVEGRLDALGNNLKVGFRRPFLGHGLGTSLEANANFGRSAQPTHNIYIEVFQELGFVGLFMFIMYLWSVFKNLFRKELGSNTQTDNSMTLLKAASMTLAITTLFFGFASYGLSSYEWYFIGALSVIVNNVI